MTTVTTDDQSEKVVVVGWDEVFKLQRGDSVQGITQTDPDKSITDMLNAAPTKELDAMREKLIIELAKLENNSEQTQDGSHG